MDERTLDTLLDEVGRKCDNAPETLADSVARRISLLETLSPAWVVAAVVVAICAVGIAAMIGIESVENVVQPPELEIFSSQALLAEPISQ